MQRPKEKAAEDPTSLGNVVIKLGWCTKDQVAKVVQKIEEAYDSRIGKFLLDEGLINEEQLQEALYHQRAMRGQVSRVEEMRFHREKQRKGLRTVCKGLSEISELSHDIQTLARQAKAANGG